MDVFEWLILLPIYFVRLVCCKVGYSDMPTGLGHFEYPVITVVYWSDWTEFSTIEGKVVSATWAGITRSKWSLASLSQRFSVLYMFSSDYNLYCFLQLLVDSFHLNGKQFKMYWIYSLLMFYLLQSWYMASFVWIWSHHFYACSIPLCFTTWTSLTLFCCLQSSDSRVPVHPVLQPVPAQIQCF